MYSFVFCGRFDCLENTPSLIHIHQLEVRSHDYLQQFSIFFSIYFIQPFCDLNSNIGNVTSWLCLGTLVGLTGAAKIPPTCITQICQGYKVQVQKLSPGVGMS